MDKNSLKKVIKPLIKECIREVLLEEGLKNLTGTQELVKEEKIVQKFEPKKQVEKKLDLNKIFKKETIEKNKKLGFDLGGTGFNPFQGTVSALEKEKMKVETVNEQKINNMIGESANQWNKILNAMNGGRK